jgi:hypothetical protein
MRRSSFLGYRLVGFKAFAVDAQAKSASPLTTDGLPITLPPARELALSYSPTRLGFAIARGQSKFRT